MLHGKYFKSLKLLIIKKIVLELSRFFILEFDKNKYPLIFVYIVKYPKFEIKML